jgi:hypothetical protein
MAGRAETGPEEELRVSGVRQIFLIKTVELKKLSEFLFTKNR